MSSKTRFPFASSPALVLAHLQNWTARSGLSVGRAW
jgi:hypothetical protein